MFGEVEGVYYSLRYPMLGKMTGERKTFYKKVKIRAIFISTAILNYITSWDYAKSMAVCKYEINFCP